MIVCPSCKHEEIIGALFCSECGARLSYEIFMEATAKREASREAQPVAPQARQPTSQPLPGFQVAVMVFDSGVILPLEGGQEFTLGRVSGNQPILPDVDLSPYGAYEGGVSRLHATINIAKDAVTIMDLGSANGTWVNGKKIPAHQPFPLQHGDVISLGKLKVQMLIQN